MIEVHNTEDLHKHLTGNIPNRPMDEIDRCCLCKNKELLQTIEQYNAFLRGKYHRKAMEQAWKVTANSSVWKFLLLF